MHKDQNSTWYSVVMAYYTQDIRLMMICQSSSKSRRSIKNGEFDVPDRDLRERMHSV